jgi:hypothetical protein
MMILGRIAVGIIILAIVIGILGAYARLDELPDNVGVLVCVAVMLLIAYCVGVDSTY